MIIQIISAYFVVFMFTMLLETPKKYIPYTATSGAVGWWVYLIVQNNGNSSMMAAFVSTLVVAVSSHILARLKKAPVTVFLVSGTLPAVPGAAIYRGVYYLIPNWLPIICWRRFRLQGPLPWRFSLRIRCFVW